MNELPDSDGFQVLSDKSLLKRFQSGSEDAANELYVRYANRLLNLANRKVYDDLAGVVDQEGIVQSVFRTFFRRASLGQYDIGEEDMLWKLLLVIALNKIRSTGTFHRADRRKASRTKPISTCEHSSELANHDHSQALIHLQMTIDEIVNGLPGDHRAIILMRIEGYGVDEISNSTSRAKRSVERILQGFRKTLQSICDVEKLQ